MLNLSGSTSLSVRTWKSLSTALILGRRKFHKYKLLILSSLALAIAARLLQAPVLFVVIYAIHSSPFIDFVMCICFSAFSIFIFNERVIIF